MPPKENDNDEMIHNIPPSEVATQKERDEDEDKDEDDKPTVDVNPVPPTELPIKNVSDAELLLCCNEEHPIGSVDKGFGSTAARGMGMAYAIPWSTIVAMLAKVGLPLAKEGLIRLRVRISMTSWPGFIKNPIMNVLQEIIDNPAIFGQLEKSMAPKFKEYGGKPT